jgi:hypothetical protein
VVARGLGHACVHFVLQAERRGGQIRLTELGQGTKGLRQVLLCLVSLPGRAPVKPRVQTLKRPQLWPSMDDQVCAMPVP